jgi:hypothetical protein
MNEDSDGIELGLDEPPSVGEATRLMSESPLQLSRIPQSESPVWPTNNAKVTAIPGKENHYKIKLSKEQDNLLKQLTPHKRYSRYAYYYIIYIFIMRSIFYLELKRGKDCIQKQLIYSNPN